MIYIYSLIHIIFFIFRQIEDLGNQKYILININISENIIKSNESFIENHCPLIMVIKSSQNSTFQISIQKVKAK